jgi:hypothetical protein
MGLSIYYEWKAKADAQAARRLIVEARALASSLPFDHVSEVFEQDAPDGMPEFKPYADSFRQGSLYLSRKRSDGRDELVHVPALHALIFHVRVEGAESASIGLASHPPVVIHREDVIEWDDDGAEAGRRIEAGDPIEFPTRRRGYYSWHASCKTQYAGHPQLGGEANFLRAHLSLIELLDQLQAGGWGVQIGDDSGYAKHRDADQLLESLRQWNAIVATVAGRLSDALGDDAGELIAPIKDRPDFEHLEAKGIDVLREMARQQRERKQRRS